MSAAWRTRIADYTYPLEQLRSRAQFEMVYERQSLRPRTRTRLDCDRPQERHARVRDVAHPMLYASVLNAPCIGVERIAAFFAATSGMYDTIAFTHETKDDSKTFLEWEGKVFGEDVAGTTVLTRDQAGLIESVQLYHRPLHIVVRFSAELRRRLQGKLDSALFDVPQ